MPVELVPIPTYTALIDAQATDRIQYAIHTATSYAMAAASCRCVEPIAMPTAFDGARGFHAILVAHSGGPVATLAAARGTRLAVTGEDSVAGRLVPMTFLARDGIDPASYFSTIVQAADPVAAITALFTGQADVAVGWSSLTGEQAAGYDFGVLSRMVGDGLVSMDQLRTIWSSPLIPFGPHAVRNDVPDDVKSTMVNALTEMAGSSPDALDAVDRTTFGGGGFVAVAPDDYAVIDALIAAPAVGGRAPSAAPAVSPPPG
jgi:phosphonate transport system substrate-binding protein